MPEISTHPTAHMLALFGHGKLSVAQASSVARHLETCPDCCRLVGCLPPDSFMGKVQAAKPGGTELPLSAARPKGTPVAAAPRQAAPLTDLPPELTNHPKFRVLRELGRGGMGVIYLAEHRIMEKPVALKVINSSLLDNADALARFHAEARAAAKLDHPNIARAYDADQAGNLHFLVMEFVEGVSLAQLLEKRGPLPSFYACHYAYQVAQALQHAYEQGMVHRDIKPHNLMLTPKGRVKVLDFGLARLRSERQASARLTQLNSFMGTPEFVSPEQAEDARKADTRSDIYSLGCTLYALLAGQPPFVEGTATQIVLAHIEKEPAPLDEVRPGVPAEVSAVVAKMLAKDPAQRYQTPVEVANALVPFAKAECRPVPLRRKSVPPPVRAAGVGTKIGGATSRVNRPSQQLPRSPAGSAEPAKEDSRFGGLADAPAPSKKVKKDHESSEPALLPWRKHPGVVAVATVAALVLILAVIITLSVKTPEGILVIEVNEPNPEVFIDGGKVTVTWNQGGKKAEIVVKSGKRHYVEVKKDGFVVEGNEVTIKERDRFLLSVSLRPNPWRPEPYPKPPPVVPGLQPTPLPPEIVAVLGEERLNHWGWVNRVSFSPDGKTLASASWDGTARLWNMNDGRLRRVLEAKGAVQVVVFSPVGHTVVTCSRNGFVQIWDPETGQLRRTLDKQEGCIPDAAFSPNGQQLAIGVHVPPSVKVWDVTTGRMTLTIDRPMDMVNGVAISPDGQILAACGGRWWDHGADRVYVKLWDLSTGSLKAELRGHTSNVQELAFSPDGKTLATRSLDSTLRLWDREKCTEIRLFKHSNWVNSMAFSPDGKTIASNALFVNRIRFNDLTTGEVKFPVQDFMHDDRIPFNAPGLVYSRDGQTLAVASTEHTVTLWDVATGRERPLSFDHRSSVNHLAISPDGQTLASGGNDSLVRLWDLATAKQRSVLEGHTGAIYATAISPDNRMLASGGRDSTIRLWELPSGRMLKTLSGQGRQVESPGFQPRRENPGFGRR